MSKPYQRKSDGLWAQQIELPPDGSGKRRRKYLYAKTRSALASKVREAAKEVAVMGDMATNSPRLSRWLTRWMDEIVRAECRPKTIANYEHMVKLINASIGAVKLDALKPSHVRRMLAYIQNEHVRPNGELGLSPATAANALRVLRKAVNDARAEGLVSRNVAQDVTAPTVRRDQTQYLDAGQAQKLLKSVAKSERAAIRWSLALVMAMRQGECLGLRADHVDLETGHIFIEWQLQRPDAPPRKSERHIDMGDGYYLTEVKSSAGERYLPMPAPLWEMMRRYIPTLSGADALVCQARDARADERTWKRALKNADLPPVRLHSARHSALTLLAQLKVPDHVRQAIAGHASAEITRQVYTHANIGDVADATGMIGAAMYGSESD